MALPKSAMTEDDRLAAYFNALTDAELLRRCAQALTREARELADKEILARGLTLPPSAPATSELPPPIDREDRDGDYIIVARNMESIDAHLLRACLESFGVPAVATDANVATVFGGALEGANVRVREVDEARARAIVAEYESGSLAPNPDEATIGIAEDVADVPTEETATRKLKTYRVYSHPQRRTSVVVRTGFSWGAFFFGPFWFLFNRMWFAALINGLLLLAGEAFPSVHNQDNLLLLIGSILFRPVVCFIAGKFAYDLLCSDLEDHGYSLQATVKAENPAYAREAAASAQPTL